MKTFSHPKLDTIVKGRYVRFNSIPTSNDLRDWGNSWVHDIYNENNCSNMDFFVGKELKVRRICSEGKSFQIEGSEFFFPTCIAEIIG